MDIESVKQKLREEGFIHIYEWEDKPGTKYEEHSHKGKVTFYIVEGDILMTINGSQINIQQGEKIDVPNNTPHTAIVGSRGCKFIVGEEIEGDS